MKYIHLLFLSYDYLTFLLLRNKINFFFIESIWWMPKQIKYKNGPYLNKS